jgi:hypothetical protein
VEVRGRQILKCVEDELAKIRSDVFFERKLPKDKDHSNLHVDLTCSI